MPRVSIAPHTPFGSYPSLPLGAGSATVAPVAANTVDLNAASFGQAEEMLVLALNTDASNPHTVTITSALDGFKRSGDITAYSILAAPGSGESRVAVFGPFKRAGWVQEDKALYFQADNAAVKFIIVRL